MFILGPSRHPVLFISGMLGAVSLMACSKQPERQPSLESASSPAQSTATDTMRRSDTSTSPEPSVAGKTGAQPQQPESQPPAKTPTPPKPSIDPGRKNPKPMAVPKPQPTPAPDSTSAAAPAGAGQSQGLNYDAASNTVTFELIAGPFNFNGYTNGAATLTVPAKANVAINFVNKDGTPHSAEVISGEGPIPNAAVDPAIPRAYTTRVLEGLPQEGKDVMQFPVPESGNYRIFCGVPGHGLSGMWIWLKVDPAAKAPSFGPTKKA